MTHGARLPERRVGIGDPSLGVIEPTLSGERSAQRELRRPDLLQVVRAATE